LDSPQELKEDIVQTPKESFKEKFRRKWNETDKYCECRECHNTHLLKPAIGLNRQNVKRLFSIQMKASDFLTLFIIIMVLIGAWAYSRDTALCRQMIKNGGYTDGQILSINSTPMWRTLSHGS